MNTRNNLEINEANISGIEAHFTKHAGGHNDACWQELICDGLTINPYHEKTPTLLENKDTNLSACEEAHNDGTHKYSP